MSTAATTVSEHLRRGAPAMAGVAAIAYLADYGLNLGLARWLEPHAYGDFKVASAFAYFCGLAVLFGGDRAAPKVLAPCLERGEPRRVWEYLRFYLATAVLASIAIAAVTWALAVWHVGSAHPAAHHPLAWVVPAIPINAAAAMISRTLQSAHRPAQAALPWRLGLPLLQLGLLAGLVVLGGPIGIEEAIVVGILSTLVIAVGQWSFVRRLGLVEVAREPSFRQARAWFATSLPMMGSFLVALALNQSDLYFLELLGDEAEVGHYAGAATVAGVVTLVQVTVVGLVAPLVAGALERGAGTATTTYRQAQRWMGWLVAPVAGGLALVGTPILALFGADFVAAAGVLRLLVVGNVSWALAALASLFLQYRGEAGRVLVISASTLVVDSLLNWVLIPRYGMDGAAAGTALTLGGAGLALLVAYRRPAATNGS